MGILVKKGEAFSMGDKNPKKMPKKAVKVEKKVPVPTSESVTAKKPK